MLNTIFTPLQSPETLIKGSTLTSTDAATVNYTCRPDSRGPRWRLLNGKLFCTTTTLSGGNVLMLKIILHTAAGTDIVICQTNLAAGYATDTAYAQITGGDSPILIDYDNYLIFRMQYTITNGDDGTADASAFFEMM